jgi:hypothetical protein
MNEREIIKRLCLVEFAVPVVSAAAAVLGKLQD